MALEIFLVAHEINCVPLESIIASHGLIRVARKIIPVAQEVGNTELIHEARELIHAAEELSHVAQNLIIVTLLVAQKSIIVPQMIEFCSTRASSLGAEI